MSNPYEVLGISPSATDDEVKTAYRSMAKKYHPDNYADSPLADVAEQKMKEVNEAYDAILDMRKNSNTGYSQGSNQANYGYSGYNGNYRQVRVFIQNNQLAEAQQMLDSVDISSRDAEWYFLQGMIFNRKGWNEQAFTSLQTACNMDPNNVEYRTALNRVSNQRMYGAGPYGNTNMAGCSCCDICAGMMCADCLCDCMRC